ncbi:MAG: carboxylate--amine ligase [Candidatus Thorarchaeota archaeon]
MTRNRNPVVVIGGGVTGHGLERTFGRKGIDVFVISHRRDPVVFSKYCKKSFTATGKRYDITSLKRVLRVVSKEFSRRAVVYPTSDLDALNLAQLKDELRDDYYFAVGNEDAVRTLVDKRRFYKVLSKNNIAHPKTYFPEDLKEAHQLGTQLDYPVFIRPSITQLFTKVFPKSGKGFVAHTPRELVYYYRLATQHGIDTMFQEVIPGPPTNSYQLEGYYNAKHNPLAIFARQRLRIWPPDFGNTTFCVSIPMEALAEQRSVIDQLIGTIGYHGLMSAEFKIDDRDGSLKLLEINARPWWHFWLSESCGVSIALTSYLDATGEMGVQTRREQYEIGVKSMHLSADIRAAAHMIRNKELSFREWSSSIRGVRCFVFLSRDDLLPFITSSLTEGYHFLRLILLKRYSEGMT